MTESAAGDRVRAGRGRTSGERGPSGYLSWSRTRRTSGRGHRRWRSRLWVGAGFLLVVLATFTLLVAGRAGRDAVRAKNSLLAAEQDISARRLAEARVHLTTSQQALRDMRANLDRLGPLLPLAKLIPVVRSQVIAVETFQSAGSMLAGAGLQLADAAQTSLDSSQQKTPVAKLLGTMRAINESLAVGAQSVATANAKVVKLKGRWLIGPIGDARDQLLEKLPKYAKQATDTEEGISALITFAGGDGPRRYLFLSQNPDEIRPTGGFIGTYGVMSASAESLTLEKFEPMERFRARHPTAVIPGNEAGSPFRFATPPFAQTLANVNNVADFARAGKLAADLWNGAGEPPVDGVVSFSPAFLARVLAVLGPVRVEDYGETVTGDNVIERFAFYTDQLERDPQSNTVRKGFISSLAEVVIQRLLEAPSDAWQPLAEAVGKGFTAREAMAWSRDGNVTTALVSRAWDGTLPRTGGDFFYNGDFAYASKSDRGLRRTFDHHVEVKADGSARITTTLTVVNTRDRGFNNPGSLCYVTIYGPEGAKLDVGSSDRPQSDEPALAGHPAFGWFVNVPPHGRSSLKVVWDVDDIVLKGPKGTRTYSLTWLRVPDHTGDVLNLRVDLPKGWRWKGDRPPATIPLEADVKGSWTMVADSNA